MVSHWQSVGSARFRRGADGDGSGNNAQTSKKSRSSSSLESELSSEEESSYGMTVRRLSTSRLHNKHRIQITLENVITFSMISAKTSEKY